MANTAKSTWAQKTKKLSTGWKGARKQAPSNGFDIALPEGQYTFQLSGYKADFTKNDNTPYIILKFVCVFPEAAADGFQTKGKQAQISHFLKDVKNREGKIVATEDQILTRLSSDLQLLGTQIDKIELADVPDLLEELVKKNTRAKLTVKKGKTKKYVVIDGPVASDDNGAAKHPESENHDEPEEEAPFVPDEDNHIAPQVGDIFMFATREGLTERENEVIEVDNDLQEVDLKRVKDGVTREKVPFARLGDKVEASD